MQHLADDRILMKMLSFLESRSLVRVSGTCTRLKELTHRSAHERTRDMMSERQLSNVMQLLRAKEQIEGVCPPGVSDGERSVHVRVPTLLLNRRVQISSAGDPEYNGIYHCTGSNGNGFIFTKPRFPLERVTGLSRPSKEIPPSSGSGSDLSGQSGRILVCIIAKRFSNEVSSLVSSWASSNANDCSYGTSLHRPFCGTYRKRWSLQKTMETIFA